MTIADCFAQLPAHPRPMRRCPALLLVIACAALLSSCGRRPHPIAAPAPPPAVIADSPTPAAARPSEPAATLAAPGALTDDEIFARKTLDEINAERPLADVFFALDEWQLSDEARAALTNNNVWLRRWRSTRITIEGHGDARGTHQYNLALGSRRADAIKNYLVSLGIAPDRVLTVSKGKEAPFCTSDHEECWQQNRRGHFIITGK